MGSNEQCPCVLDVAGAGSSPWLPWNQSTGKHLVVSDSRCRGGRVLHLIRPEIGKGRNNSSLFIYCPGFVVLGAVISYKIEHSY